MALDRALACPRLWCAHHWSASNDRVVRLAPFSEPLPPMLLQANDRSVRSCSGRAAALVVRNTRRFHVIDPDGRRWPRFDHRIEIVLASICLVTPAAAQSGMADADTGIAVRLTGFLTTHIQRSSDGTLPIRWSNAAFPWIDGAERLREAWQTRQVGTGGDAVGVTLHSDADPDHPLVARTCAEWSAATAAGRYAMSTLEMSREIEFIHTSSMLTAFAHAKPAAHSSFLDFNLLGATRKLLPPSPGFSGHGVGGTDAEAENPNHWSIEGNRIHWNDDTMFGSVEPVLFGDLDGDGWEDMLLLTVAGASHGTMRAGSVRAIACVDGGPLVDITCRLSEQMPPEPKSSMSSPIWNGGHRIAPAHPFTLEGTCRCSGAAHPLRFQLEVRNGLLEGTARCAVTSDPAPAIGALGANCGQMTVLRENGIPSHDYTFEWMLTDGTLSLKGSSSSATSFESTEFDAQGTVLTHDERLRMEGWSSELRFQIADATLLLRRACGTHINARPSDVVCLDQDGIVTEIVRLDRIEWGGTAREPESDPATNDEIRRELPNSVYRVKDGSQMLLLAGWSYGASTNNPFVIAIPIHNDRLNVADRQMFPLATIDLKDGVASILVHDLRAGVDPYRDDPHRAPIEWNWLGYAWSSE